MYLDANFLVVTVFVTRGTIVDHLAHCVPSAAVLAVMRDF